MGYDMAPRFPNTTEPHGPHRSCDGHHIIIDYREDCDRQHSQGDGAVLNYQGELLKIGEWQCRLSQTRPTEPISKLVSQNAVAPRMGTSWTTQGDYHRPFGKVEARAEAAKWLCQFLNSLSEQKVAPPNWRGFFLCGGCNHILFLHRLRHHPALDWPDRYSV